MDTWFSVHYYTAGSSFKDWLPNLLMAPGATRKISAASARAHTRKSKQKSSIPLPSGSSFNFILFHFIFLICWLFCPDFRLNIGKEFLAFESIRYVYKSWWSSLEIDNLNRSNTCWVWLFGCNFSVVLLRLVEAFLSYVLNWHCNNTFNALRISDSEC